MTRLQRDDPRVEAIFNRRQPVPAGQRCEHEEHLNTLYESDLADNLATTVCYTEVTDDHVCFIYICENCLEAWTEPVSSWVDDEEGWPVGADGEPVEPTHCEG